VLNWLIEVDLVEQQEDKTYVFRDPVLQMWVAYYYAGLELTAMPRQKVLDDLVTELMEKYQRVTTELGLAKESQVRELLQRFAGQEVDGDLLGLSGSVRLPTFQEVAPYRSDDGQVEVDALAEACTELGGVLSPSKGRSGDERWAVEIKWRGKMAGLKEVQKLARVAQALSARPWFISRAGFTPEAVEYARQEGIMHSGRDDIKALAQIVGEFP